MELTICPECGKAMTPIKDLIESADMDMNEWPELVWCPECGTLWDIGMGLDYVPDRVKRESEKEGE